MNERQKAFAEYFAASGNGAEAARRAGYSSKTARSQGQRLLTNADIQEYIEELQERYSSDRLSDVERARRHWIRTMEDPNEKPSIRLRASELLAKAGGAFINRIEVKGTDEEDVVIYLPANGRDVSEPE